MGLHNHNTIHVSIKLQIKEVLKKMQYSKNKKDPKLCSGTGFLRLGLMADDGDFATGTNQPSTKRRFGDIDDDEGDIFGSKKANIKAEETAPGDATGMILSLRESLESCKDELATCKLELEARKSEVQKWHSIFQNESILTGTSAEPEVVVSYLHDLKSSKEALKDQLENRKKKEEAAFIATIAKQEQEMADLEEHVKGFGAITQATKQGAENLVTTLQATEEEARDVRFRLDQCKARRVEIRARIRAIQKRL